MCIKRVNSFDELSNLYSNLKGLLDIKKGKHVEEGKYNISICGGTGCQASRSEEIKSELDKEVKAQKMCATQLKNLEKKLTEKMERRDAMLAKYISNFENALAEMSTSFIVDDEENSASFRCEMFGTNHVLFTGQGLSDEAIDIYSVMIKEMAELIVMSRINGTPYNESVEKLLKLDKEIKKNPTLAKEKLVAREVKNKEKSLNEEIEKINQEITTDEELLQHYNHQLEGKPTIKNNLIN